MGTEVAEGEPGESTPIRGIFAGGCAAASGAASKLRASITRNSTALYHMVVSSSRSYADHRLSIEA